MLQEHYPAEEIKGDWLSVIGLPYPELTEILSGYLEIPKKELPLINLNSFWPENDGYEIKDKFKSCSKEDLLMLLE